MKLKFYLSFCWLVFLTLGAFSQNIVISEVYGGGGNTSAVYKNDFIELYNPTSSSISLAGWSVQYASSSGTTWAVTALTGSIAAKGYYLIQEASGGSVGAALPLSDAAVGSINLSASNGKVALVNSITALSGSCPSGYVDLLGYGTANCFEGAVASAASNIISLERKANSTSTTTTMGSGGVDEFLGNGQDSNNNASDFVTRSPQPQNSSSAIEPLVVDTTPPTFTSSYPKTGNILSSGFDVFTNLNEAGKTYFVVLTNNATTPTSTQVKNGQDDVGNSLSSNLKGTITNTAAAIEYNLSVTGLSAGIDYDVYAVAEDNVGNLQTSPSKVDVTTATVVTPVLTPSATTITFLGVTSKIKQSAPQTYTLSASDLSSDASISVTGSFLLSKDDATYASSISIDKTLFSSAQTIYIKFNPSGNSGTQTGTITNSSTGATDKTLSLSAIAFDPFNQNFNDPNFLTTSGWGQYSKTGAQVWATTNFGHTCLTGCTGATVDKAAQINGYASVAQDNEDWLISPQLDLTGFVNYPALSFWSISAFAGDGLQLKYSTNYTGSGDPTLANWTTLDGKFPASNTATWTKSSNIILPKLNMYVAVIYTSNTTAASRWTFDDWLLEDTASYIDVPAISYSFGEIVAGNSSASKNFTFTGIGYGDITVTPSAGYEVSLDNATFAASQVVAQSDAAGGRTIYVRFAPSTKQLKWNGSISFTGAGLNTSYGTLTGSSYPKVETLDVVCYNLEFFGTDVKDTSGKEFGPTDDALQVNNVRTVLQTINADIYGVEEVADDAAFNTLVSGLTGYDKILSDKWSYSFNTPDPNFPPQKVGFIYNTSTVQVVSSRVMFAKMYDDIRGGNSSLLPGYPTTASSFWSSGRLPFMVTFDITINGFKKRIRVIDIHAKSGSATADYNRRKYDVQLLRDSLVAHYANDNIILVGDYNDDVDVSIAAPAITNSSFKSFVDDATNFNTLTYSISTAGAFSFPSSSSFLDHIITSNELTNTYITNSITVEDPRTYISNYTNTTSDHLPVSARFLLDVKTDQTITFNTLPAKKYGDAAFTLSANSTSGLPISYSTSDATVASIAGNSVTILKPGTVTITANQVGDGSYNAALSIDQSLTVNKADQTIAFNPLPTKIFGDASFIISATSTSILPVTLVSSDATAASISGNTITILKAGTVSITAKQAGDANYNAATDVSQSLTINKADQAITFNTIADKKLIDPSFSLVATTNSLLPIVFTTTSAKITLVGSQVTIVSAGRANIKAAQSGNANYNAATDVTKSFCIQPAKPTISSSLGSGLATLTSSATVGNQWFLNGTAIAGATNNTYSATTAGTYKVQTTVDDCVSDFSIDTPVVITGDINLGASVVRVYPNPTSENLFIIGLEADAKECIVLDILGRSTPMSLEKVGEGHLLPTGNLSEGFYFLRISENNHLQQIKFIKKN